MSGLEPRWTLAQKFYEDFHASASELASRLETLKLSGPSCPSDTMQVVTSDLSRLTKSLGDATGTLPSYDQRQCELTLKTLEKSVEELRGASASVPKFSFKRKAMKDRPSASTNGTAVGSPLDKAQPTLIGSTKTLAAVSHRYLTLRDVRSPISSAEVSIADLDNCIVNFLPIDDEDHTRITALHVQRVSKAIILLPRIAGSIILHDVSACVIAVGCHQFRMHDSAAVDVYLESGSDPIIEHCSNIRFAAYPTDLMGEGLLQTSTQFSIKDFSHILPTQSPNWSFIPEKGREKSWPSSGLKGQALQKELERMLPAHSRPVENDAQA